MSEIRLSPLQVKALLLLSERGPAPVTSGRDVHGAVVSALVGHGLVERGPGAMARQLHLTDTGRQAAARLRAEQATEQGPRTGRVSLP